MVKGNKAKESKKWVMECPATWPQTVLTYFKLKRRIYFFMYLLQEGWPMGAPVSCSEMNCSRRHVLTKQEILLSKGHLGEEQEDSVAWLEVSGFMMMGLVSRLSLANHSDSGSFLVVHVSLSQDGFQQGGFWEVVGHVVSPCEMNFPKFFWLVLSY